MELERHLPVRDCHVSSELYGLSNDARLNYRIYERFTLCSGLLLNVCSSAPCRYPHPKTIEPYAFATV